MGKDIRKVLFLRPRDSDCQLPEICTHCNTIISTCRINQSCDDDLDVNEAGTVTCHECDRQFSGNVLHFGPLLKK